MSFQEYLAALKKKANQIRIDTLKQITSAGSGKTGSALSAVEMLVALYYGETNDGPIMELDMARPGSDNQDYFILSKSGAAPAWYAILADLGFFDKDELRFFKQTGALLSAYPRAKIPGVAASSSLPGQGVGAAVGLAMALRADRARNKVWVMMGDAEMASGASYEALLQAGHHKLGNLVVLVDKNTIQMEGLVRNANVAEPLSDKFETMGFRTINVFAGHDLDQLLAAYEKAIAETRLPVAIIVKTVKAKGVDFAEGKSFYHDKPLSQEELDVALESLERKVGGNVNQENEYD
ncbi:MAG: transketolase [Candidatus Altimarinota bacterium]